MYEIVEGFHKALRIESTWAFVLIVAFGAAAVGGFFAWIIDMGYRNSPEYRLDHPDPKPQAVVNSTNSQGAPATAPIAPPTQSQPTTQVAIVNPKAISLPEAGPNWNTDGLTFGPPEEPPQGDIHDPRREEAAQLTALPKAILAPRITAITAKMRDFDQSWMIGDAVYPPPDSPAQNLEGKEREQAMAGYWQQYKEWEAEKAKRLVKFRNIFFEQFKADMPVLAEMRRRFPKEMEDSRDCKVVFGGVFEHGQMSACADYLDDLVRQKLD